MSRPRPPLRHLKRADDLVVKDWLTSYISMPHDDLGRDGAICPFVPKALAHGLVVPLGRAWKYGEADDAGAVADLILDAIGAFRSRPWPTEHPELRSVVAVATGMPRAKWPLLDDVQQTVKGRAAADGLMLGPFHRDSTVPAALNPGFAPNISPYPLVVVRQMSVHDLWFLHERRGWFREYQKRFADRYSQQAGPAELAELYHAAAARYGQPRHADPRPVPGGPGMPAASAPGLGSRR